MKVLFLGGTGVISSACSRLAVSRGIDLSLLNRGQTVRPVPEGARLLHGDVRDRAAVQRALGDTRFDAVVNWINFQPEQVEADIELFRDRTAQYIFISSASAYQKPLSSLPITESTPLHNPFWGYSQAKIACEERLMQAYQDEEFPITIVRPSHTYDRTKVPLLGHYTALDRMRKGKKVIVHGDGTSLWTLTHHEDFAKGFVGLLGNPHAIGQAFHITSDEVLTWNQIYTHLAHAAQVEPQIVHVPSDLIAAFDAEVGAGLLGDKAHSVIFDNSKIKRLVPGFVATIPFWQGAQEIVAWYEADPARQVVDEQADRLIERILGGVRGCSTRGVGCQVPDRIFKEEQPVDDNGDTTSDGNLAPDGAADRQRALPVAPTADEALALIDSFFRNHGLDPEEAADAHGWRRLSLGSAHGQVGVMQLQTGEHHLVVLAPLFEVEAASERLAEFYRQLLELNHDGTMAARFSLHDGVVCVSLSRPIRGLGQEEVNDAIREVMVVADGYQERLAEALEMLLGAEPVSLAELPNIKMTPREAQLIGAILAGCDAHGKRVFRYLMERWQKAGYQLSCSASGIGLRIPVGLKQFELGAMLVGAGERRQFFNLGWEGLRRYKLVPLKAVDRFQAAIKRIAEPHVQETTAHLWVTKDWNREDAEALFQALKKLARSVQPELDVEEEFTWDPSLPTLDIHVGPSTLAGIQETLLGCEARVQALYATLIEGWNQA